MLSPRRAVVSVLLLLCSARVSAQTTREHEPNDEAATATVARMGDTIAGTVNPSDVDYYAVDLEAGTQLELIAAPVQFCRDFSFLDPSGNRMAFGDCMDNIDTLRVTIPASGRYLIRVTQFDDAPRDFPLRPYSLHIGTNPAAVDVDRVVKALLGGDVTGLDAAFVQRLDDLGNGNGILDVGDLRAYMRAQGFLVVGRGVTWN
jgi:hypothetical protein